MIIGFIVLSYALSRLSLKFILSITRQNQKECSDRLKTS